jgi:glutamate N-acetyltransferase/amino-acid N-acetyltransferase
VNIIDNSICAPKGFKAAGVHAGVRKNPHKLDVALIYSEVPAVAAGVFTQNLVKAAPVLVTQEHLSVGEGMLQAVVINSGNANACTGQSGIEHARLMASTAAAALNLPVNAVGVSSTGVIGMPLPIDKITVGIKEAAKSLSQEDLLAAQAIMTTDTVPKTTGVQLEINGKIVTVGGIAKGSGMIHPNMATMLGFVTTDVAISQKALQEAVRMATDVSFNMITVDGDSSTNDMLLVLANGMAENAEITSVDDPNWYLFYQALQQVCITLAKLIAQDGEGATKLLEVEVTGAFNEKEARIAARAVCRSPLVKSAVFGADANWGRVACALGGAGVQLNPEALCIWLDDMELMQDGMPLAFDEVLARGLLLNNTVVFRVDLGVGTGEATAWGCDLTYDYVKINASYRS